MKKNTAYFIIGSVALLFLVGIFIYISTGTYSVNDITNISINDVSVPINGTKTINVSFDFYNNNETVENADDYYLEWEINPSSGVTLGSLTTNLNAPNNTVTALSMVSNVMVTVRLYYNDNAIATDSANVNIFDVENVSFTNVSNSSSFSINITNANERMLLPSKYSSNRVVWDSSDKTVLTISDTGVINPVSSGNSTVSATVYDDENNIIALGIQVVTITENASNSDDISGADEDDYSLSSISINGQANILEGLDKNYVVTLFNETSFKVNAVAKNGGTVKIINSDGKVYNNNESISWEIGSPTMAINVCVVNSQNKCISDDYKYQIILEMSGNSTVNKEGYLESLTIGSDKIIENGAAVGNYVVNCDDEADDDVFWCKVEYTAKAGTKEVNVNVKPKSNYAIDVADENPIILSEGATSAYYTLVESNDPLKVPRCLYEIIITVPSSSGGNTTKPEVTKTNSSNATSNPGTADMSSFIIFMVMLVSLIASLFVYKKNVGNN